MDVKSDGVVWVMRHNDGKTDDKPDGKTDGKTAVKTDGGVRDTGAQDGGKLLAIGTRDGVVTTWDLHRPVMLIF